MIYLWVQGGILAKGEQVRLKPSRLAVFAGCSAIILLSFNIWQAQPWPYLLQLLIAWTASMVLYLNFIQVALDAKVEGDSIENQNTPG